MNRYIQIYTGLIAFLLLFSMPYKVFSQTEDNNQETPRKMAMEVIVTDHQNNPRQGEKIIFVDNESKKEFSGVTNESGKFDIKLPGGRTYIAKIAGVGEQQKYQTFEMPEAKEGQSYGTTRFTIKYEPPKVYTLDNVYFDVGKANLRDKSFAELNELVDYMKRRKNIEIEIAGHTDNTGTKEDNQKLSQRRADRVKKYLISKNIDARRIKAKGYGEDQPVAGNNTKEGRQKNRRTEVRIIGESYSPN
ncbi:MAG: OmpA family protein [Bacteroidota bacterium]